MSDASTATLPKLDGKVAGIPVPVAIAAAGAAGYLLYTHFKSASAANAAATNAAVTTAAGDTDPYASTDSGAAPIQAGATSTGTTTASSTITTNTGWAEQAEVWLLAQNYNPTLVDSAVRDYLAGNQLDTNEQAVINVALQQFGPLPDPNPPVGAPPTNGGPVPTPGVPKPVVQTAKQSGSDFLLNSQNIPGTDGHTYAYISAPAVLSTIIKAGSPTYLMTSPPNAQGKATFVPFKGSVATGTAVYQRTA